MGWEDGIQTQVTNVVNEFDNCPALNFNVAFLFFILSLCDTTLGNWLKHKKHFISWQKKTRKESKLLVVVIIVSKGI